MATRHVDILMKCCRNDSHHVIDGNGTKKFIGLTSFNIVHHFKAFLVAMASLCFQPLLFISWISVCGDHTVGPKPQMQYFSFHHFLSKHVLNAEGWSHHLVGRLAFGNTFEMKSQIACSKTRAARFIRQPSELSQDDGPDTWQQSRKSWIYGVKRSIFL